MQLLKNIKKLCFWGVEERECLSIRDLSCKVEVIIFGSVWFLSKKVIKPKFFFEKKPKPSQTNRFRFGFLGKKPVQTGLARFFFRFFSVLVSVRFDFFSFLLIKPKPNRTGWFFQNFNRFNRFFFRFGFFSYFFPGLIGFSIFFSPLL